MTAAKESSLGGTGAYFKALAERAKERRENIDSKELAEHGLYVRINRDGFRLVSITTSNPCGNLGTGATKSIETIKRQAVSYEPHPSFSPGNSKSEHRLQAYLIRQCLMYSHHPEQVAKLLDPKSTLVDKLWFVADEVRLGDAKIRADMVFIGSKSGTTFPILAELKAVRTLGRVLEQLADMRDAVVDHDGEFSHLLSKTAPNFNNEIFDCKNPKKWIIWPATVSGRPHKSVGEALNNDELLSVIELKLPSVLKTEFRFDKRLIFSVL